MSKGKDDLATWAATTFNAWFDSTAADDVVASYRSIMAWAQGHPQFTDAAKAEFADASDGWLVAYALDRGCVIVTNETFEPGIKYRIKIPNACEAFKVQYVDTFGMLRKLGVTL